MLQSLLLKDCRHHPIHEAYGAWGLKLYTLTLWLLISLKIEDIEKSKTTFQVKNSQPDIGKNCFHLKEKKKHQLKTCIIKDALKKYDSQILVTLGDIGKIFWSEACTTEFNWIHNGLYFKMNRGYMDIFILFLYLSNGWVNAGIFHALNLR